MSPQNETSKVSCEAQAAGSGKAGPRPNSPSAKLMEAGDAKPVAALDAEAPKAVTVDGNDIGHVCATVENPNIQNGASDNMKRTKKKKKKKKKSGTGEVEPENKKHRAD